MKIIKKRIRNIWPYLNHIKNGEEFYIGITKISSIETRLTQVGFSKNLNIGEKVLPSPIGPVSSYNAIGIKIPQKDKPKETFYQEREWNWKDWGGNEHSGIFYIPRKRYPRKFILPPSEELQIVLHENNKILISTRITKQNNLEESIKHIINLFLELFGECEVLDRNLTSFIEPEVIKLNWKLLPPGEYPWKKAKEEVKDIVSLQPKGNQPVVEHNLETITNHVPTFVAIGQGGFNDYLVFGFPEKNLFILESVKPGNATYVFEKNWEELSRLSKKEILDQNFQLNRFIHKEGWENSIDQLLN